MITLNKIRKHNPCADGWEKLLRHIGKTKADDEPLSLLTVLESNGFVDALWCLRAVEGHDARIRKLACDFALEVAHLWSMPDVVRQYLETQNASLRTAAQDAAQAATQAAAETAARAAAQAAAETAAWAAARATARAAVRAAAWAAAWAAARAAAWAAAWAVAEDAAWAVAEGAAWAAAWAVAEDAAEDAAWAVAEDAAWAKQEELFKVMVADLEAGK